MILPNTILLRFFYCACKNDDFAARLLAVLKSMYGFIQALCLNFKIRWTLTGWSRAFSKFEVFIVYDILGFTTGWEIIFRKSRVCWSGRMSMQVTFLSLFSFFLLREDNQNVNRVDARGILSRPPECNRSRRICCSV